ncbi:2-oxoglutarate synthase subunit alpha [Nitratifractor sp.]|uniref:2-oxoglutarate synthase subunit alpha n=1 Tax=Nitratifractor sp. TaxID=2268144 RepID=UPI0025E654D7|nr:2-oxoglutarate synthase subunit alpha [Nitratifractor sp.]
MSKREVISSGNDLAARAAVDAGCKFFGGYPITPSSEIMHTISDLLPKVGGACMQMEDEIAGICSAIGASMSGVRAMTATSGPGISLKAENIGLAQIAEVPLVIVNVMRGGPSTGLPTRVQQGDVLQAKNPTHGDVKTIVTCPGTLAECYTETVRAFNLADRFMQPVFVLLDETLGHMHAKAELPSLQEVEEGIKLRRQFVGDPADYRPYDVPDDEPAILNPMFKGYRYHYTGLHHGPTGFPTEDAEVCDRLIKRLFNKVDAHVDEIESYEEYLLDDAEYLVVAYGSTSLAAREAVNRLREEGVKIGMFRPITLFPSPDAKMKELQERFGNKVYMAELNMGQYVEAFERATGMHRDEFVTHFKANGRPISPADMIAKIKEELL